MILFIFCTFSVITSTKHFRRDYRWFLRKKLAKYRPMEPMEMTYMDPDVSQSENPSEDEEELERKHFQDVVNAFRSYKVHCSQKLYKTTKYISSLPAYQQALMKSHRAHLHKVYTSIERNYEVIKLILQDVSQIFENSEREDIKPHSVQVSTADMEKVLGIFKQINREWSADGQKERDASFLPILEELMEKFPDEHKRQNIQVLVPGAGLGRLPYEIAKRGFTSQGNELSLFMLFVSNFILNKCRGTNLHRMHPWVHQSCNNVTSADQVHQVSFPDVDPSDIPTDRNFSMAAGNFTEIYVIADAWDCVATCFFLDTAHNVITYIETIWKILKPGGIWINLGPLLYHHADLANQDSVEPTYQDIKIIIQKIGFVYCVGIWCLYFCFMNEVFFYSQFQ